MKINYAFIPYPKLKAKELAIYDLIDKDKILAQFETVEAKLPLKDLLNKKRDKKKETYWITRRTSIGSMKRQF